MMRVVTALLAVLGILVGGLPIAGGAFAQSRTVVVYTAGPELVRGLAPLFQQRTGYEMQIVTAGSGELTQRLRAEAQRPQADVAVSLGAAIIEANPNLFEAYTP